MSCVDTDLLHEVGERANIILLAPTFESGAERWCSTLLEPAIGHDGTILYVTDAKTPDSCIEDWREQYGNQNPGQVGFVTFNAMLRSNGGGAGVDVELEGTDVRVRPVDSPGNLTKLGVELNSMLTEWSADAEEVVVCFHSLTSMIQYGDVEKVYRFLHVFANQVRSTGAHAHYHLDPTAHEETDVNLLKTICDAVVEPQGDGEPRIQTR